MIDVQLVGFHRFLFKKRVVQLFQLACATASFHKRVSIDAALVGNATSRKLNKKYRHIDAPTDVLSFRYPELPTHRSQLRHSLLFGEIVIARDIARKQAKELGHSFMFELQFLLLHGFLHILGYDHEKIHDAKIMFRLQDQVIAQLSSHD